MIIKKSRSDRLSHTPASLSYLSLCYYQPQNDGTITITTTNAAGVLGLSARASPLVIAYMLPRITGRGPGIGKLWIIQM